jgi:LysR family transcriptional regulator, hydrogen peroxide-inducible genes activator
MEMHQLRYFVAIAQTGSFSRAAERCCVSQPSMSQQIQKLETGLSQRLFDRLGRRVVLTEPGRVLLDRALAILAAVEDAERRLKDDGEGLGGHLSIGAIPTIAPYLLPLALQHFQRTHPSVEFIVQEDVTRHLLGTVEEGEIDLALVALPVAGDRLEVEPLFSEPLLLALPPRHRLARKRSVTLEDLREEKFILLGEMHCLGEQVLSLCHAHGCEPRISCRSAQIATIQSMIALGQGVSLLPEMARRADRSSRRVYRVLSGEEPRRTIAVVWRKHRYHSLMAERFLATLRELAAAM